MMNCFNHLTVHFKRGFNTEDADPGGESMVIGSKVWSLNPFGAWHQKDPLATCVQFIGFHHIGFLVGFTMFHRNEPNKTLQKSALLIDGGAAGQFSSHLVGTIVSQTETLARPHTPSKIPANQA